MAGGFWDGVVTFDAGQTSELFVALTTEDGRYRLLSVESNLQVIGAQEVDGNDATGSGLGYADTGSTWQDGTTVTEISTELNIDERVSFSGSFASVSGESGTFEFFYDAEYELPSSLSLLEGLWTVYDDFGNPAATFTIDGQGAFTGQNTAGCSSTGQISIIDDRYNLYDVNSVIANCFIAGDYTGLAALGSLASTNDVIALSISNNARAIVLGLQK